MRITNGIKFEYQPFHNDFNPRPKKERKQDSTGQYYHKLRKRYLPIDGKKLNNKKTCDEKFSKVKPQLTQRSIWLSKKVVFGHK